MAVVAARVRVSLSTVLVYQGDVHGALAALDRAAHHLHGLEAARLLANRAAFLNRLGRTDEALAGYDQALRVFRREGDVEGQARVLNNRGLLHVYQGSFRRADADLDRAEQLRRADGLRGNAAVSRHNRGFSAARRGDIPTALALYDEAEQELRELDVPIGPLALDRCEAFLTAGLASDARTLAEATAGELRANRIDVDLAEALLLCSHAALLDGDPPAALAAAEEAVGLFRRQRRTGWTALARYAAVRAAWAAGQHSAATLAAARRAARQLDAIGLDGAAVDARIIAGRIALEGGRRRVARSELTAASRARRRGTSDLRARAWHAEALVRMAEGDRRGADAALRAGLGVVEAERASLGASELRSHLSTHVQEAAGLGLDLALDGGSTAQVFGWMERLRANALLHPPVRPPHDPALAAELVELRAVAADLRDAATEGRNTAPIVRRQAEVEAAIRRRTMRRPGQSGRSGRRRPQHRPPTLREISDALGDRALVELASAGGSLHAVVVAGGRSRRHPLGPIAEVHAELDQLRFVLRRLAYRMGSERSLEAAVDGLRLSGAALDRMLLAPLADELGDRSLVVVPTGELHALPWSVLPSCSGRPVTVSPSAGLWHRAAVHGPRRSGPGPDPDGHPGPLLVAGPDLPDAAKEVTALARRYPSALRLTGADATVAAVTRAMSTAGLAHLATHGAFRADNPLFSCLSLADGPLTVYDLETLPRTPEHLVLSACQSGLSAVRPGDELMGLAAALFTLGTRTLVASVIPVPDAATRPLMLDYHRHLAAGAPPSVALAAAAATTAAGADPPTLAAGAGFVCFGAG